MRPALLLLALLALLVLGGCGDDGSGDLHQQGDAGERCIHVLEGAKTSSECQDR